MGWDVDVAGVMSEVLYRDFRGDGSMVLVMPQRVVADDERGFPTMPQEGWNRPRAGG